MNTHEFPVLFWRFYTVFVMLYHSSLGREHSRHVGSAGCPGLKTRERIRFKFALCSKKLSQKNDVGNKLLLRQGSTFTFLL